MKDLDKIYHYNPRESLPSYPSLHRPKWLNSLCDDQAWLTFRGRPTFFPIEVVRRRAAIFFLAVPCSSSLVQSHSSNPCCTHRAQGRFRSHPFLDVMQRVQRPCSPSSFGVEGVLETLSLSWTDCFSSASSTRLGERIGVARGSVSLINWIATSSSEITLADVGVGVGRGGCLNVKSRDDALKRCGRHSPLAVLSGAKGLSSSGIKGKF